MKTALLISVAAFFSLAAQIHDPAQAAEGDNGVSLLKQIASADTLNSTKKILFEVWRQGSFKMDLETRAFYEEVSGYAEFGERGGESFHTRKWQGDIPVGIWPDGDKYVELIDEFDRIVSELNLYMETAQFVPAKRSEDVKFWVIFDEEDVFLNLKPSAETYLKTNYGLFYCNWNRNKIMTSCAIFIDTERANRLKWQKHLLREEVTQALGLMNDSPEYPDSMFYSKFSNPTEFSYRDVWSVYELYRLD